MLSSARSNCVSILAVRLKTHGAMIGSDSACFEDFDARSLDMTSKMSSSSARTRETTPHPAPSSLFNKGRASTVLPEGFLEFSA